MNHGTWSQAAKSLSRGNTAEVRLNARELPETFGSRAHR